MKSINDIVKRIEDPNDDIGRIADADDDTHERRSSGGKSRSRSSTILSSEMHGMATPTSRSSPSFRRHRSAASNMTSTGKKSHRGKVRYDDSD